MQDKPGCNRDAGQCSQLDQHGGIAQVVGERGDQVVEMLGFIHGELD